MDEGVDRDELGGLLAACEEYARVGSACSSEAESVPWASSTVSAKFTLSEGTSFLGLLRGAATLTSSLMRPISTAPVD